MNESAWSLVKIVIGAVMVLFLVGIMFLLGDDLWGNRIDNQALMAYEGLHDILNNPTFTGQEKRLYEIPEGYAIVSYNPNNWDDADFPSEVKKFPQCKGASCICLCAPNCEEYVAKCDEVFGFEFVNGEELIRGTGQPEWYAFNLKVDTQGKRSIEHLA